MRFDLDADLDLDDNIPLPESIDKITDVDNAIKNNIKIPILVDNLDSHLFDVAMVDTVPKRIQSDNQAFINKVFLQLLPSASNSKYIFVNSRLYGNILNRWAASNLDRLVAYDRRFECHEINFIGEETCKILPHSAALYSVEPGVYLLKYFGYTFVFVNSDTIQWSSERYNNFLQRFTKSLKPYVQPRLVDKNAFDRIVLDNELLEDIKTDITNFLDNYSLYKNKLKIPWKRGYMLIGPPGVGKTLLIKCIRDYFGFSTVPVNKLIDHHGDIMLSSLSESSYLESCYLEDNPFPIMVIMEDVDKFIAGQGSADGSRDYATVSLHSVLKAMDGIEEVNNVIIMATTNYGNLLSEALINRPGRFDRVFKIDLPSEENIIRFLNKHDMQFCGITIEDVTKKLSGCSTAFVEEFVKSMKMTFKTNVFNVEQVDSILTRIHKHTQSIKDLSKKIGF